jgi:hypothetical protein
MRASRGTYQWPTKPHTDHTLRGGAHASSRSEGRARGRWGDEPKRTTNEGSATHAFQREFISHHAISARVYSATCIDPGVTQSNCHKAAAHPHKHRGSKPRSQSKSAKTPKKNVTSQAATKRQWTMQHSDRGSWHPCRRQPNHQDYATLGQGFLAPLPAAAQAPVKRGKLWGAGLGRTPRRGRSQNTRYLRANTHTRDPPTADQPT